MERPKLIQRLRDHKPAPDNVEETKKLLFEVNSFFRQLDSLADSLSDSPKSFHHHVNTFCKSNK